MKKQALLIGINQYQFLTELKYARQDAEAVAVSLKQNYCFSDNEIMVLTDSRSGLFKPSNRMIIRKHLGNLANQEFDLFIFGFWGHGLFRNGERFLCPQDVMGDTVEEMGISFKDLQRLLSNVRAKNTCLILDCCQTIHDRGEAETLTASDKASMENGAREIVLWRKEQIPDFQSNVAILNSCKEGQSAYEWDECEHGIFTAHLLDAMDRRLDSVSSLISYVENHVKQTAMELGKEQTPFYTSNGDSDFPLPVASSARAAAPGDVFISYRSHHIKSVEPILNELRKRGITYYIDREKLKSGDYASKLTDALNACKVLLLFWTQDANDSKYVPNEISLAFDLGKEIIPYKIGDFDIYQQRNLILYLKNKHLVEDSCDTIIDLVDSVEQALTGQPTSSGNNPVKQTTSFGDDQTTSATSSLPDESDSFSIFIKEEKLKRQKQIQDLLIEAQKSYKNQEYSKAIAALDVVLKLEQNLVKAKDLKALCLSGLELQVAEDARRRRITEEAERERREEETKMHDLSVPGAKAGERKTVIVNDVEFAFRWCPAGTFIMGAPKDEEGRYDDETQHQVTLTKGFWMMETQVTQKQWKAVMWSNPSNFIGDDLPVEKVSWNDCQEFCKKCAQLALTVQLPTEAQWEYACRAGSTTAYFWGNALNGDKANCDGNYPCGTITQGKYQKKTMPVGSYEANAWGLYDMHGNVREWCQDWYGDYPGGSVTDPTGPSNGLRRVYRGGGWRSYARNCRSANRSYRVPEVQISGLGFRVSKLITSPEN